MSDTAFAIAIRRAGSEEKLGRALGYSQHAIWKAKVLNRVSAEMAIKIHFWSGGEIALADLRPDLVPTENAASFAVEAAERRI